MSVTVNFSADELDLDTWIADGWTTLKLYSASSPDGSFTDTGLSPTPTLLSTANTAGPPHDFTFAYSGGNAAMWFKVVLYNGATTTNLNDASAFHGGGGTTLQVIRQRIGKLTHNMQIGATTSAGGVGGNTAICTTANFTRFRDDYFGGGTGVDGWFFNNLGTNTWTVVSDWTQSTGTFTFSPVFAAQVGSAVSFEVSNRWTPDEYRDAINWAIVSSYPVLSKPIVDTSIVTVDNIMTYSIPNNIRILNKIEIETDRDTIDNAAGMPWRQVTYGEIDDGLSRSVEFKHELSSGRRLRFTGTTMLNQLYNDSDYVEVIDPQVDLIVYLAAHRLYAMLANTDTGSDIDRVQQQATYYMTLYNEGKTKHSSRRKSKKIWSSGSQWNY